jgi:hypothetical protein
MPACMAAILIERAKLTQTLATIGGNKQQKELLGCSAGGKVLEVAKDVHDAPSC